MSHDWTPIMPYPFWLDIFGVTVFTRVGVPLAMVAILLCLRLPQAGRWKVVACLASATVLLFVAFSGLWYLAYFTVESYRSGLGEENWRWYVWLSVRANLLMRCIPSAIWAWFGIAYLMDRNVGSVGGRPSRVLVLVIVAHSVVVSLWGIGVLAFPTWHWSPGVYEHSMRWDPAEWLMWLRSALPSALALWIVLRTRKPRVSAGT